MVVGNRQGGLSCLVVIARHNDRHVGQHLHHADILKNLMRCSVLAECQPSMGGTYLDVFVRIGNALSESDGTHVRWRSWQRCQ